MKPSWHKADSTRTCIIASLPCNETCKGKETTTQWGACSPGSGSFLTLYGDSRHPTKARQGFWRMQAWLVTRSRQRRALCPFLFLPPKKRQIIYRKKSKIVKIYQYSKNIENKLKYFKKCVDKCTALYYIKLNKRETEQPNREGWERSTKESIEREV